MKVTVIPIIVVAHGKIPKNLEKGLGELERGLTLYIPLYKMKKKLLLTFLIFNVVIDNFSHNTIFTSNFIQEEYSSG